MQVRQPIFAYQGWYPAEEESCRRAIDEYLSASPPRSGARAGIVPHAGWHFSGATAGKTFSALAGVAPELVFVFGGHMAPGSRPRCMPQGAFGTPLGPVEVDEPLATAAVAEFSCEVESHDDFQPDNTIELQMPFIRRLWPQARVVALQVPPGEPALRAGAWAAAQTERLGRTAVAVGSTDLTHYGPNYGFMPRGGGAGAHRWSKEENDRPFIDRLLRLDAAGAVEHALSQHSACCPGAAAAAVEFARARGAAAGHLLEHVTSAEVEGRKDFTMWVGYAALVF